jgi:hypothetical protein
MNVEDGHMDFEDDEIHDAVDLNMDEIENEIDVKYLSDSLIGK